MRIIKMFNIIAFAVFMALVSILPVIANCQSKGITCLDLKNGVFYSYPKNTADHFFHVRDGDIQREANLVTGDTAVWKVNWVSDCIYALKYVSGVKNASKEVLALLKDHKLVYQIEKVTEDYYIFTGHLDKVSNVAFQKDTMWLHEKANVVNNQLFKPVANPAMIKREHFSDTSKYALLYLYRPGKFTNSLGNYLVYFEDNLLYLARNNSGYLFKILKEGSFKIRSQLFKDESSVNLNVKFGNTYYVKSMIHWGIYSRLYNFKLEMAMVQPEQGKMEFEEVNYR